MAPIQKVRVFFFFFAVTASPFFFGGWSFPHPLLRGLGAFAPHLGQVQGGRLTKDAHPWVANMETGGRGRVDQGCTSLDNMETGGRGRVDEGCT